MGSQMTPLKPNTPFKPALVRAGKFKSPPDLGVVHYTAGSTATGALESMCSKTSEGFAHFLIGRNGDTFQVVRCDERAWHAGRSTWKGREECNDFSIGIELVNPGWLRAGFSRTWPTTVATHRNGGGPLKWYDYPDAQMLALYDLVKWTGIKEWVGHDHIAPGRKADPGPLFDYKRLATVCSVGVPNG